MGSRVGVGALRLVFLPSARPAARPAWPAWPAWIGLGMLVVLAIGFSRLGPECTTCLYDVLGAGWLAVSAWRRDLAQPERPASAGHEPAAPESQSWQPPSED
jgi:hypothetical protein